MRKLSCFLVLLLVASAVACAQSSDDSHDSQGIATIDANWRFHTGDDPAWAAPEFDDSHWSLLRLDKSWAEQGYRGTYGFAWYRLRLKLPASSTPLALEFIEINSANEIYADGQLIGSIGKMRPAPVWLAYSFVPHSYPLPVSLNGKVVELAIRVWQPKDSAMNYPFAGRTSNPRLGDKRIIDQLCQLENLKFFATYLPGGFVSAIGAAIGFFSIGLFLLRPQSKEYAWAALFLFADAFREIGGWCYRAYFWPAREWIMAQNCIEAAIVIFWLLFIWRFLRAPRDKLLYIGIILVALAPIPSWLAVPGYISVTSANLVWVFVPLAVGILVFARLMRLAVGGNREALLLMIPFLLNGLMASFMQVISFLYYNAKISSFELGRVYNGPYFYISWDLVTSLISYLAVSILLMMRFTRSTERDERLSAELEAAHQVQIQLVPAHLPSTESFRFEAAYFAASEVGGDFYQVLPQPDGSVLVVIGDVSGKGLKAAMLGTMVVGALRSMAQEELEPAILLSRLNEQLIHAADGAFVTCSAARLDPDGLLTFANAGHLPPYLNQREISCEPSLPLGLVPDVQFTATCLHLKPSDRLTFLSDGVVEARCGSGELFGFERAREISSHPANQIARAAQSFGQQDDITVLTLTFAHVGVAYA
jgi:sigma-B regulation protein RsbU (phosphoserine phosphatase)